MDMHQATKPNVGAEHAAVKFKNLLLSQRRRYRNVMPKEAIRDHGDCVILDMAVLIWRWSASDGWHLVNIRAQSLYSHASAAELRQIVTLNLKCWSLIGRLSELSARTNYSEILEG